MNSQDLSDLTFIAYELAQPDTRPILARRKLSRRLLSLFKADFLGQTRWNSTSSVFENPICYNRSEDMSRAYENHYQFCDPLTPTIRNNATATATYDVISRPALERTEYFVDFLRPNKVAHGLDQYLFHNGRNIGDLRIWRQSADAEFTPREKKLLSALKQMLNNAYVSMLIGDELEESVAGSECIALAFSGDMRRRVFSPTLQEWIRKQPDLSERMVCEFVITTIAKGRYQGVDSRFTVEITHRNVSRQTQCAYLCKIRPNSAFGSVDVLTKRERQVGCLVAKGLTDSEIATELGISYWTVRTHVGNLLGKLKARNRVELAGHQFLSKQM